MEILSSRDSTETRSSLKKFSITFLFFILFSFGAYVVEAAVLPQTSGGMYNTCALKTDGSVRCWGLNSTGQLGDNTTVDKLTPTQVYGLTAGTVKSIAGGNFHTCALKTDGSVVCWGTGSNGQVGDGSGTQKNIPTQVSGLTAGTVKSISAGTYTACAVLTDGSAVCWGDNGSGQGGHLTYSTDYTPVQVYGLTAGTVQSISSGGSDTCAVLTDGSAKCWGMNFSGEIGDNTITGKNYPVQVYGLTAGTVQSIITSAYSSCAVKTDGSVVCWGANTWGQLGDNTTVDKLIPTQVSGLTSGVKSIVAGQNAFCVLKTEGSMWCWGYNAYGSLGDNTTVDKHIPTQVSGLTAGTVQGISFGYMSVCAVQTDYSTKCWGYNGYGQLGDNTVVDKHIPTPVSGFIADGSNISVSPSSGSYKAGPQTFTTVYRDGAGATNINYVDLLINYGVDGNNTAMYGQYIRSTNTCYLFNSDNAGGWAAQSWQASPATLPIVTLNSCSSVASGNDLTVTWNLTFNSWVESNMNLYTYLVDNAGLGIGWSKSFGTINVDTTVPATTGGTINASNITADASTQYQITTTATDTDGGANVSSELALINYVGVNTGQYRGYLGYSSDATFPYFGGSYRNGPTVCTGGGSAATYNGADAYGSSYINLVSCNTSIVGNQRTVVYTVTFNPSFTTPLTNNTIGVYAADSAGNANGWNAYGTFGLAAAPTITTPTATSIGITSATLGATITSNNGSAIISRGTCYSTISGQATLALGVCVTEGGTAVSSFTYPRNGLSPGVLYYYQGYAANGSGTSYSGQGTFTTQTSATLTSPTSTSVSSSSAMLGATLTSPSIAVTARGICWGTTPSPTLTCISSGTATGVYTQSVTGLAVGTLIYYRGYATYTDGAGATLTTYSPDGSFTTLVTTSMGNGTDPGGTTLAPGGPPTFADSFTLQSDASARTVTSLVVNVGSVTNASVMSLIEITSDNGAIVYGFSSNPTDATTTITLNASTLTATTALTQYKIRITPKSHASMPGVPGALYTINAKVDSVTPVDLFSGTDTGGTTLIIDNLSPVAVTNTATTWVSRASVADNTWTSVTYGNGIFVAVACGITSGCNATAGTRVMTSPDGITWTAQTAATSNQWRSVTYANGLFVAVSDSGIGNRVMTSPDGITWTSRASAADNNWFSVTYGNGLFVAVGQSGTGNRVMTSPDGITWTSRTSAADINWQSVIYGNGLFVAVAISGTGNRIMTSPDGITWTIRTSPADNNWFSVTYANGLFVAVATTGIGNRVMTSPDGINWTLRTSAADNQWNFLTYGNGTFVAVAVTGIGNRVMTSPDGINWTLRTSAADNWWNFVTFGNGMFVATGYSGIGNRIMTSTSTLAVQTPVVSPGYQLATLSYQNPADSDLSSILILQATSTIGAVPVEGATYWQGNSISGSTVACVKAANPLTSDSCDITGLTNGIAYYLKTFWKDTSGNYSVGLDPFGSPVTPAATITILGPGIDPTDTTIGPGSSTSSGAFTFRTSFGSNVVSSLVVNVGSVAATAGISLIEITSDNGSIVYGSSTNPTNATTSITLNTNTLTATVSPVQYKIRITAKSHANMPGVPGALYTVNAKVDSWVSTNTAIGSDTGVMTLTIDNLSPSDVISSVTPSDSQALISYTTPIMTDLYQMIALKSASAVVAAPVEGTSYYVGDTIGASTVACIDTNTTPSISSYCSATGLSNGSTYHFKLFSKDVYGNYSAGSVPSGSPATIAISPTTIDQSGYRFFASSTTAVPGTAMAAQNTAASLVGAGDAFRLRLTFHAGTVPLGLYGKLMKLQYAPKVGTCDTGFVGETYNDITTSTPISFYDTLGLGNNSLIGSQADLTHGADTVVNQSYFESNPFMNSQAIIPVGQDGKFDYSLYENGAALNTSYCLRAVNFDGSPLTSYSVIPEITPANQNVELTSYRFRNDDGTDVTATYAGSESSPLSNVFIAGDKVRLRLVITNKGAVTSTKPYQLEYATSSCTTWTQIPRSVDATTQHWKMEISPYISDNSNMSHLSGVSVPNGKSYATGMLQTFNNVTQPITLTNGQYTELEYTIRSTPYVASGVTYCFRPSTGGSNGIFTYPVVPQITPISRVFRSQGGGTIAPLATSTGIEPPAVVATTTTSTTTPSPKGGPPDIGYLSVKSSFAYNSSSLPQGMVLGASTESMCVDMKNRMLAGSRDGTTQGEVSQLQYFLKLNGYFNSKITGYYGAVTENAVKKFQADNKLIITGTVGKVTREKMKQLGCVGL